MAANVSDYNTQGRTIEMLRFISRGILGGVAAAAVAVAALTLAPTASTAQSGEPITIGFSMALTGPLGGVGSSALLAMQIWEEDQNAKGGLLGRPVKLVYYDDTSKPDTVPGIYTKLLDADKVDLIVGPYATGQIAPSVPIAMQKGKVLVSLFGTGVNEQFKYDRYFSMISTGPDPKPAFTAGYFEVAMAQNPKPETIALVGADAEFGRNICEGARINANNAGLKIVYDSTYPPNTTEVTPIVRAIQATNPDLVVICSYPVESAAFVRAIDEVGFKPKMIGGGMVGLQLTPFKTQLGPLLNGIVNYEMWLPASTLQSKLIDDVVAKYQARAADAKVDPLGYYIPPWAYSQLQVLAAGIEGAQSLDDAKIAEWLHANPVDTVVGKISFGPLGEWTEARILQSQFQNIKGTELDEFKDMSKMPILTPSNVKTGEVIYPYADAK
jgi:branched-chain amino acid transport system substrate-binding protein